MTNIKTLTNVRQETLALLDRRFASKYIDARSHNRFTRDVLSVQSKKLNDLKEVFKDIKKLPQGTKLTKSNFKEIYDKIQELKKTYKITIYGIYIIKNKYMKVPKPKREALDTFEFKGSDKKLQKELRKRKAELMSKHYETDDYYENNIRRLSSFEVEKSPVEMINTPLNQILMRNASVLHRDWLKYAEGITKQAFDDMGGKCVYELLSSHLTNSKARLLMTKEKLFDVFNDFHKKENGISDLDMNTIYYNKLDNFTMDSGVSTEMIKYLCEQRKISLYAYDGKQNCFEKLVFKNSNYKPIAYYCIDGHMYLINDPKVIRSISETNKESKVLITSLLELDQEVKTESLTYIDVDTFEEALKLENTVAYIPLNDITDEVHNYISETKNIPIIKSHGHSIISVFIKSKNLSIICDPNLCDGYTWKEIKQVCDKANIKFNNQTIGGLIKGLNKKYQESLTPERRVLTKVEKDTLIKKQYGFCALCQLKCDEFEMDHITPLVAGGSNDDANFQALCKTCHKYKCSIERDAGDYIKCNDVASSFNDEALKIIQSSSIKHWAFIDTLAESDKEVHKIDHVKCRRNLVMHSEHDFPKFSVMDYPIVYDGGNIKCGYYFVETNNYFPLRGNGWYNYVLIKYCIEQNIQMKITHQFTSSFTLDKNHFTNFSEYLLNMSEDINDNFSKKIINSMVGCWNINKTSFEQVSFTLDKYEASRELCRDGVMVLSTNLKDSTLFSIVENKTIAKDDLCCPLYHQVLAMEAVELHKLKNMIVANGCEPLELNTDSILYKGPMINIDDYFYDSDKQVKKYRYDNTSKLKVESVCRMVRTCKADVKPFIYKQIETDNREFIDIVDDVIKLNQSCLITGMPGVGKTYLANMIINELEKNGKVVGKKLAPTNKASSHIGGETIHKFYMSMMLSQNYEKKLLKNLNNFDYIVIDEISMVKEIFYRFFTIIRRYAPKLKYIVIGDFKQFKPVEDIYKGDYLNSVALHKLCDGNQVNLTTCKRSDAELFNIYSNDKNIENIDLSKFEYNELTDLNISYCHKTRKNINKQCIDKFIGDKNYLMCEASRGNKKSQDVKIFEGLPIVAYRNIQKESIFNSEVYHIHKIDIENKTFSFMIGDEEKTFKDYEFKNSFYPAFCITAHVSQGATFDKPYTIWDWNHLHADITFKYVTLSRATKINNIQIKI